MPPAKPGDKRPPLARAIDHIFGMMAKTRHSDEYVDMYQSAQTQDELSDEAWTGLLTPVATNVVLQTVAQAL